jgi:hypothetical protein
MSAVYKNISKKDVQIYQYPDEGSALYSAMGLTSIMKKMGRLEKA